MRGEHEREEQAVEEDPSARQQPAAPSATSPHRPGEEGRDEQLQDEEVELGILINGKVPVFRRVQKPGRLCSDIS